jgi:hypothetical protein
MSATLRMTQETHFPAELRRGRFEIEVDGTRVGSIENHKTVEVPLEPGHHAMRMWKSGCSNRDHTFDVADGERAQNIRT